MINLTFVFIFLIFILMTVLAVTVFVQVIMLNVSLASNKKEILEGLKKYDNETYLMVTNNKIPYRKKFFKVVKQLCEDGEIKNDKKTLYFFSKHYKIIFYEILLFAFLLGLSTIIIQVIGKKTI